jgi:hypothetical protein
MTSLPNQQTGQQKKEGEEKGSTDCLYTIVGRISCIFISISAVSITIAVCLSLVAYTLYPFENEMTLIIFVCCIMLGSVALFVFISAVLWLMFAITPIKSNKIGIETA